MAMRQINIFVEGHDDHELVVALLHQLIAVRPDPTRLPKKGERSTTYLLMGEATAETAILVLATGGWTRLPEKAAPIAQRATRNLIIFDADTPDLHPRGGQVARREAVIEQMAGLDPQAYLFLLPDNTRDGNLETLLLDLVQPPHDQVMACFDHYDNCLAHYTTPAGERLYHIPSAKRRVYDYVNVLPLTQPERVRHEEQNGQKIFDNPHWWNLTADAIKPLRQFLLDHVS